MSGKRRSKLALFVPVDAARGESLPARDLAIGRTRRTVILSRAERAKLVRVNRILTELTDMPHPLCGCKLCQARTLTDTQDEASFTIPGVTLADDAE
jgi:hypothetical protein